MSGWIERHHDYVLSVGTVAASQIINPSILTLDLDAPFVLRSRAAHMTYDAVLGQELLQNLLTKYTDKDQGWLQQDYIPLGVEMRAWGLGGSPAPVVPAVYYPQAGTIFTAIQNMSATTPIPGVELYFRGVKRFAPGSRPTYPAKCSLLPYTYHMMIRNVPVNGGLNLNNLTIAGDADFAIQGIQFSWPQIPAVTPQNVWLTLRDDKQKAYSNAPVALDVIAGSTLIPNHAGINNSDQIGAWHPALIFPEIYLPASGFMYVDVLRNDAAVVNAAAQHLALDFIGVKVFHQ
jgi:hypothetical protein